MLFALLWLAAPFTDTQDRFTLELPKDWKFAPLPGDTLGAAFQRDLEGVLGNCIVKVLPVSEGVALSALVERLAAAVQNEPGYRLLHEELDNLAEHPAIRRRYVVWINGDSKWPKMAQDHVAIVGDRAYIFHVETLAEAWGNFESDFDALLRGFKTKGTRGRPPAAARPNPALAGTWVMQADGTSTFELRPDGTFDLAGTPGVWKVDGAQLVTLPVGGAEERFTYELRGAELTLHSPSLPEPIVYVRKGAKIRDDLTGRWASEQHRLQLSPNGTAMVDQTPGTYAIDKDAIVLKLGKSKRKVILRFRMQGEQLVVSGGSFGQEHALTRQP